MAQLKQIWQRFFEASRESDERGERVETAAETSKFALELAVAFGVGAATVSPLGIALAGLSFVGLSRRLLKHFQQQHGAPSLEDWVAIAAPLAYLESFEQLARTNLRLKQFVNDEHWTRRQGATTAEGLGEFQLDESLAREALSKFHESKLAMVLGRALSRQLQTAGMKESEAKIVAGWVAWKAPQYMPDAAAESEEVFKQQVKTYLQGQSENKYDNIENYLNQQVATKPQEKVFAEQFTFQDIYVPLQAKPVDANGKVNEGARAFGIEDWAKEMLESESNALVMFIQGGPGRGKSVFCRMFADWVRQHLHPLWTPISIRLRDIVNFEPSFEKTLTGAVNADFAKSDSGWLTDNNTRYLFLLDGFDELRYEGRASGGIEQFIKQVGVFQQECQRNLERGHRVLITGHSLALQGLERYLPSNLARVELQPMNEQLQGQWLQKWTPLVGEDKATQFGQFLKAESCPKRVQELAREPLLLYLLAAMHRDGKLNEETFAGASGTEAKILIYQRSLDWVLTVLRPEQLLQAVTGQETEDLRHILAEAGLCVIQSGGEVARVRTIEERLQADEGASELLKKARERHGDDALKNALVSFYIQAAAGDQGGAVEFAHKSFSEFLCAERIAESLVEWTRRSGRKRKKFEIPDEQFEWEVYDLFGFGALTPEIVEYLMGLLKAHEEFRPLELFQRLEEFYLRWSDGEFIDAPPENLPQRKMRLMRERQGEREDSLGQRQVDVYTGLNTMIVLLELHRYARGRDDLKDKINFHPCGQKEASHSFDQERLLRIINYSNSLQIGEFLEVMGSFLSNAYLISAYLISADLSNAYLSNAYLISAYLISADLSNANLSSADLRDANLSSANLSFANLSSADLRDANLDRITWNEETKWDGALGLETARNVPDELKRQLGL